MQYMLRDFELFPDKKEGALFYSPEISAHITNENVVKILQEIKRSRELSEPALNKLTEKYNLQDTAIKDFLIQELKILSLLDQERFNKFFISSDDADISNILYSHFSTYQGVNIFSHLDPALLDESSLLLVMCSTYNAETINDIYRLSQRHNAWVITAYIANNYLIIDNMFNARKGMPCHFCNFNRHQNLVMSKNSLKKTSWINFCRRAIAEEIGTMPAMRLGAVEQGLAAFYLAKTIKNYLTAHGVTMFMQEIASYHWVNLITGEVNQEQAVHWVFCHCLTEDI